MVEQICRASTFSRNGFAKLSTDDLQLLLICFFKPKTFSYYGAVVSLVNNFVSRRLVFFTGILHVCCVCEVAGMRRFCTRHVRKDRVGGGGVALTVSKASAVDA